MSDEEGRAVVERTTKNNGSEIVQAAMAVWQRGGLNPDVAKNIRPEHITQALEHADRVHERLADDRKDVRRYRLRRLLVAAGVTVVSIALLVLFGTGQITADLVERILLAVVASLGGYGLGTRRAES